MCVPSIVRERERDSPPVIHRQGKDSSLSTSIRAQSSQSSPPQQSPAPDSNVATLSYNSLSFNNEPTRHYWNIVPSTAELWEGPSKAKAKAKATDACVGGYQGAQPCYLERLECFEHAQSYVLHLSLNPNPIHLSLSFINIAWTWVSLWPVRVV